PAGPADALGPGEADRAGRVLPGQQRRPEEDPDDHRDGLHGQHDQVGVGLRPAETDRVLQRPAGVRPGRRPQTAVPDLGGVDPVQLDPGHEHGHAEREQQATEPGQGPTMLTPDDPGHRGPRSPQAAPPAYRMDARGERGHEITAGSGPGSAAASGSGRYASTISSNVTGLACQPSGARAGARADGWAGAVRRR